MSALEFLDFREMLYCLLPQHHHHLPSSPDHSLFDFPVMDFSEPPTGRPSPRRELQGPRPTPLKVSKDSYKIKKPPVPPQPSHPPQPPAQNRPPVIIYAVSPKVIHTDASEFMTLVQRLTGPSPTSSDASDAGAGASSSAFDTTCAISPAARFAAIEKTNTSPDKSRRAVDLDMAHGVEMGANVERTSSIPGILSPLPSSLPPISPNFFSPPSDPTSLGFLHELSPIFHGNKNYIESFFMSSPSAFLSPPNISPTPSLDLFNPFSDF
ncbi:PREDICTED: protein MKS1 [Nelumbo nucifera]|uniref:Protein MKS1 n=1 Tax=Nelumbo nucifera TaxID=4432 RepID=A0A1U7ZGJ3_NELNU|nr:PREDICTED: protein MKS1 [Nelumbo nucifera]